MKKRVWIVLLVSLLAISLLGCSGTKGQEFSEEEMESMENAANVLIQNFQMMSDEDFEQWEKASDFKMDYALMSADLPISSSDFLTMAEGWQNATKEYGELIDYGEFSAEASGKDQTTLKTKAEFEKKKAELEFQFDKDQNLVGLTVNIKYSKAEILEKAGLNTLLGMGTVFAVLIFIAFVISLFRIFPYMEKKKAAKKAVQTTAQTAQTDAAAEMVAAPAEVMEEEVTDAELAAVIAAAVAAYEGKNGTGGLMVRSIRRHKSNNRK